MLAWALKYKNDLIKKKTTEEEVLPLTSPCVEIEMSSHVRCLEGRALPFGGLISDPVT